MPPAALALLTLYAAMAGSVQVADEIRAYAARSPIDATAVPFLEDQLRLDAAFDWPVVRLTLGYAPSLTIVDAFSADASDPLWLHSGELLLAVQQPRYTLTLSQTGVIGNQDFVRAGTAATSSAPQTAAGATAATPTDMGSTTTTAALGLQPDARAVAVAGETTSARLAHTWARRWDSEFGVSYGFSGGLDSEGKTLLPRERKAQIESTLGYEASSRDRLDTSLSAARIDTSNGYAHVLTSLSELWTTRFTRGSSGRLGLGVAFQDSSLPDGTEGSVWSPTGSARVTHELRVSRSVQAELQAEIGYAPEVNVLTGQLQKRVLATATAGIGSRTTSVQITLEGSQTLPSDAPDAVAVAGARLSLIQELTSWLGAQAGGQFTTQRFAADTGSNRPTFIVYAALSASTPELRF